MTKRRKSSGPALFVDGYGGVIRAAKLPDDPPAQHQSDTSVEAAKRVRPRRGKQAQKVLDFFREVGERGATAEEVAETLDLPRSSAAGRCTELMQAGQIVKTKRTRPTRYGCPAAVHVINSSEQHGSG